MRAAPFLMAMGLVAVACTTGSAGPRASPSPVRVPGTGLPGTSLPPIPLGTYRSSISLEDAERTGNGHLINLATQLAGRYELTLAGGSYAVSIDGRVTVPAPSPRRTGGEGAYGRYGIWVFLGVPPIGQGTYEGSPSSIVFHSTAGACFQAGAPAGLVTGRYRWELDGGSLRLVPPGGVRLTAPTPGGADDACLGRVFVFSAHPWQREG